MAGHDGYQQLQDGDKTDLRVSVGIVLEGMQREEATRSFLTVALKVAAERRMRSKGIGGMRFSANSWTAQRDIEVKRKTHAPA